MHERVNVILSLHAVDDELAAGTLQATRIADPAIRTTISIAHSKTEAPSEAVAHPAQFPDLPATKGRIRRAHDRGCFERDPGLARTHRVPARGEPPHLPPLRLQYERLHLGIGGDFGQVPRRSPLPGLVFARAGTRGPGVEAAMISGAEAADALLPGLLVHGRRIPAVATAGTHLPVAVPARPAAVAPAAAT